MTEMSRIEEDLGYVRAALGRGRRGQSPAGIYFLWAAIVLAGFSLVDLAPRIVGLYWLIAAPVGFLASAWLGWRASRRMGELDRAAGRRQMLHWLGLLIAGALAVLPVVAGHGSGGQGSGGQASWYGFGATVVLLSALTYWLAGVHGDRPLLVVGALLFGGYAVVVLLPEPAWIVLGVLSGTAMAVAGWSARRSELAGTPG
jgi:hypothetical protein